MTRRIVLQIAVNLALVAAIFLGASYAAPFASGYLARWLDTDNARRVVLWSAALVVALPFLVAVYRKLESLALLLAEVSVQPAKAGRFTSAIRSAISGLIPIVAMFGVFLLVAALSGGILPPFGLMVGVLLCAAITLAAACRNVGMPCALRRSNIGSSPSSTQVRISRARSRAVASETLDALPRPKSRRLPFFCTRHIQLLPPPG